MHFVIKDLRISCDGHEIEELVADNDGYYHASFEFDSAWDDMAKTARFICNDGYYDSLIGPDNKCLVPSEALHCVGVLRVGVFAGVYGESLLTTTSACVRVIRSVLTDSRYGLPDDPDPAIYTQIVNTAADALNIAKSVEERANSGEFNGRDGKDLVDLSDYYTAVAVDALVKGSIKIWQPNTEYQVGDVVIATSNLDDKKETVIAICNKNHTSAQNSLNNGFTNDVIMFSYWDIESINVYGDEFGNCIHKTYATKEELTAAISEALEGDY